MGLFNLFKKKDQEENDMASYAPVAVYPEFEDVNEFKYNLAIFPTLIGNALWYTVKDSSPEKASSPENDVILAIFQWLPYATFFVETFISFNMVHPEEQEEDSSISNWPPEYKEQGWPPLNYFNGGK